MLAKSIERHALSPGYGQTGCNPRVLVNAVVSMGRRNTKRKV